MPETQQIIRLKLSSDEINKLSTVAKDRKFNKDKVVLLYSTKHNDLIESFLISYRFLMTLSHGLEEDNKEVKEKIDSFVKQFEDLNRTIYYLHNNLSKQFEYGKSSYVLKAETLILDNYEKISILIDDVYPLGKVVSMYDPEEAAGAT